jgi:hypothetical protein
MHPLFASAPNEAAQEGQGLVLSHEHALCREVFSTMLASLRPDIALHTVAPGQLDDAVKRLRPWMVVCSAVTSVVEQETPAWILLSPEETGDSVVFLHGERRAVPRLTIEGIVALIDEVRPAHPSSQ